MRQLYWSVSSGNLKMLGLFFFLIRKRTSRFAFFSFYYSILEEYYHLSIFTKNKSIKIIIFIICACITYIHIYYLLYELQSCKLHVESSKFQALGLDPEVRMELGRNLNHLQVLYMTCLPLTFLKKKIKLRNRYAFYLLYFPYYMGYSNQGKFTFVEGL